LNTEKFKYAWIRVGSYLTPVETDAGGVRHPGKMYVFDVRKSVHHHTIQIN